MGAWNIGPFDNDDAADFLMDLEADPSWQTVRDVFTAVLAGDDYLQLPEGAKACAAAALLTVATGRSEISAQDIHMVLADMGPPPADLGALARAAVKRLSTGASEIRELYLDTGSYGAWRETVIAIEKAL